MFKMNNKGVVYYVKEFGRAKWLSDDYGSSMCKGVASYGLLVAIVVEFAPVINNESYDVYLFLFTERHKGEGWFDEA